MSCRVHDWAPSRNIGARAGEQVGDSWCAVATNFFCIPNNFRFFFEPKQNVVTVTKPISHYCCWFTHHVFGPEMISFPWGGADHSNTINSTTKLANARWRHPPCTWIPWWERSIWFVMKFGGWLLGRVPHWYSFKQTWDLYALCIPSSRWWFPPLVVGHSLSFPLMNHEFHNHEIDLGRAYNTPSVNCPENGHSKTGKSAEEMAGIIQCYGR